MCGPSDSIKSSKKCFYRTKRCKIELSYKSGAKNITTRLPVVEIIVLSENLFSVDQDFEVLLEAHDKDGNVVGEAKPGGIVNPATGTITLKPEKVEKITIKMSVSIEEV